MTVAEQVVTIYAGVKGYLDSIEINQIRSFEKGLLELVKSEKPEVIESIEKSGKIDESKDHDRLGASTHRRRCPVRSRQICTGAHFRPPCPSK